MVFELLHCWYFGFPLDMTCARKEDVAWDLMPPPASWELMSTRTEYTRNYGLGH